LLGAAGAIAGNGGVIACLLAALAGMRHAIEPDGGFCTSILEAWELMPG